jgi:hypothetical protein
MLVLGSRPPFCSSERRINIPGSYGSFRFLKLCNNNFTTAVQIYSLDIWTYPCLATEATCPFFVLNSDTANLRNVVPVSHYLINTMDGVQRKYSRDIIISLSFTFKNILNINLLLHKPILMLWRVWRRMLGKSSGVSGFNSNGNSTNQIRNC